MSGMSRSATWWPPSPTVTNPFYEPRGLPAPVPPLPGRATGDGTLAYTRAHEAAAGHWRTVGQRHLSSLGLGSYLGETDDEANRAYEEAAFQALSSGINVLDAAANYRDQQSERDLGRAVARFGNREQVFVATKGGFLPGDAASGLSPREYVRKALIEPGILRTEDVVAGCHAMTPKYLQHQIQQSQKNLGIDTIDLYFLHNPETQAGALPAPEFEKRLLAAFGELEEQVDAGHIASYGLATWDGLRVPPGSRGHLSLERCLHLAQDARDDVASGPHNLKGVELPVNLAMPEAIASPTQEWEGEIEPVLSVTQEADLVVFASATLVQGQVIGRLPPYIRQTLKAENDRQAAIQFARSAPGVTTALVGMGQPAHVRENAAYATKAEPHVGGVVQLLKDA